MRTVCLLALFATLALCLSCAEDVTSTTDPNAKPYAAAQTGPGEAVYGGTDYDEIQAATTIQGGGYALAGMTRSTAGGEGEAWFLLVGTNGNLGHEDTFGGARFDSANCVIQTSDTGFLLCGTTFSTPNGDSDVYLVKLDNNANFQWETNFGGTGDEAGWWVIESTSGGYLVVGESDSPGTTGGKDLYLARTDQNGAVIRENFFGGIYEDTGHSIIELANGDIVMCGTRASGSDSDSRDMYVLHTDGNGNLINAVTPGAAGTPDTGSRVIAFSGGGFVAVGTTRDAASGDQVYLVRLDAGLNTVWEKNFGGAYQDRGLGLLENTAGQLVACGLLTVGNAKGQAYILATDAGGNLLWERNHGASAGVDVASDLLEIAGGYLLAGRSSSFSDNLSFDGYLVKTDANGDEAAF
ncbi:MAG: hypothetical protein ACLFOY_16120 [Desulfatibacillaceae bacterium]